MQFLKMGYIAVGLLNLLAIIALRLVVDGPFSKDDANGIAFYAIIVNLVFIIVVSGIKEVDNTG